VVVEGSAAGGFSAFQHRNLPIVDTRDDHIPDALRAEVVLAATHEKELSSQLVPGADAAVVLLLVELTTVPLLGLLQEDVRNLGVGEGNCVGVDAAN